MSLTEENYFEKIETQDQKDYVCSQTLCVLCGSYLELLHIVLDQEHKIREEAYCPHCQTKTRAKEHTLI